MSVDKTPIKYEIKQVNFVKKADVNQTMAFYYKLASDSVWSLVADNITVDTKGFLNQKVSLENLLEKTEYQIRVVNKTTLIEYVETFTTCGNMYVGESPLYMKKLYKGQHFTWYLNGLQEISEPTNTNGFYYKSTEKFAEFYSLWGPLESPNGKSWVTKTSSNNTEIVSKAFNIGQSRYLGLNWSHTDENARLFAYNIMSTQDSNLCFNFYIDGTNNNVVLLESYNSSETQFFKVTYNNGIISLSDETTTVSFSQTFATDKWYGIRLIFNPEVRAYIYEEGNVIDKITSSGINPSFFTSSSNDRVYFGAKDGSTNGLNINRMYFTELPDTIYTKTLAEYGSDTPMDDTNDANQREIIENLFKIFKFYDYTPTLVFKNTSSASGDVVFLPNTNIKLGDQTIAPFRGVSNRSDVVVDINYDLNSPGDDYTFCLKGYLYQYDTSSSFQEVEITKTLSNGNGNITQFVLPNDFAYSFRLDFNIILPSGTSEDLLDFKINSIDAQQAGGTTLDSIFKDNNGTLLINDSTNGDLINLTTVNAATYEIDIPALNSGNVSTNEYKTDIKWIGFVRSDAINTIIDPDIPSGDYTITCKSNTSGEIGQAAITLLDPQDELHDQPFSVDFSNAADFEAEKEKFVGLFDTNHTQWGGYNGGTNGELIYFDETEKCVVLEQHGDEHPLNGEIKGVAKPAKDSSFNGYGIPSQYTGPNDPNVGADRTTRVGSILITKKYCEYGRMNVNMKIPTEMRGLSPALWFFHYMELYPSDPRWDEWIAKGGQPYSGGDPYMVINNEIDMELPSHVCMGVFASWDELENAYFDPDAIDDQYRVGVQDPSSADKYGTFLLIDTNNPNSFSSWVKESSFVQDRNEPLFNACKFNNWIGEKSSGNGWAYDQTSYGGEQYLAYLTKLAHRYNDNQYHEWGIAWYPDRTELYVDNVLIRTNRAFVPFNIMKYTFGGWFPTFKEAKIEEFYNNGTDMYNSGLGSWAGINADFDVAHIRINKIDWTPFTGVDKSNLEYNAEGFPEAGIRELKLNN
ncbi:hypothetical protein [Wenyingzhuangia sp. IMCC45574]